APPRCVLRWRLTIRQRYPGARVGITENVSAPARPVAGPARAAMLLALARNERMAATDLAVVAGVSPQTASFHLAKLMDGRLITWERAGRARQYRMAQPAVAQALAALSAITWASPQGVRAREQH